MEQYIIYPGVEIARWEHIGPFVLIGVLPRGAQEGSLTTRIGDT
jgi:hypothetical protein